MEFEKIHSELLQETLYKGKHKSGLSVYVLPKQGHSKSYASFAARVGSIDNAFVAAGETGVTEIPDGVAHFLEHKLFEQPDGTNAFDQYNTTGASANAFTSFNTTAYLFSSTDNFYGNLEILLDFVGKPHFTDENVAKEQGIIGQEIRMYEDDPNWRVFFNLLGALYQNHPVRNDIAGTVESISRIDRDVLYKCYHSFYNPSNMALFTCGDVDCGRVAELVDKYVTASPIGSIGRFYPVEPPQVRQSEVIQKLSVASPIFLLGFKDNDLNVEGSLLLRKQIVTEILLEMLAGKSSATYNSLYEQGLINQTFDIDFTAEGNYAFSTLGGESCDPLAARDALLEKIGKATLTQEAFDQCKKVVIGRHLRLFNSVEKLSNSFVSAIFRGTDLFEYLGVCDSIALEEVQSRKDKHFTPQNSAVSIIEPF